MVGQIYTFEPQISKANCLDTEAPFLDLSVSILNEIDLSKINDKRGDFNF